MALVPTERIERAILLIRGHKVMLDEFAGLRSQFVTSSLWSQRLLAAPGK